MHKQTRLALYYFAHFAAVGAIVPYVALWFAWLGHSPSWTGMVIATPSFLMVLTTLSLGSWADRLDDWRTAVITCSWVALLLNAWWLYRTGPLDLWVIWTVAGVVLLAKQPIIDAGALNLTQHEDIAFGRVRAFGSVGFIVSLMLCGWWFEGDGIAYFLYALLLFTAARVVAAHKLPRLRPQKSTAPRGAPPALLRHPGFLGVLAGAALINASHAFYYTFGLLHWRQIGIDTGAGSVLWAIAIAVEIVLMWQFARIANRVSARHCLVFTAVAGMLRWAATALDPNLFVLGLMQALHALSFGLCFLAVVSFIARRIPDAHAARAQSLYAVVSTGSMAAMTLASGYLFEAISGWGYLVMAGACALGLSLILWSYRTDLDEWQTADATAGAQS